MDTTINYICNAYPATANIFHLCSPAVNSLLKGVKPGPGDIRNLDKCISLMVDGDWLVRSCCLPWNWSNPGLLAMAHSARFVMGCEDKGVISVAHVFDRGSLNWEK
jgi:hypothetical protein